jgi:prepilin-type N-terminal cleavage/methylation domain-containing protein
MVAARKLNAGFTLTEMMVVVVILSILAALSIPLFTHDNNARKGRDWAKTVAQLLQRARFQAMGDRADIHVLLYRTRVDMYRKETTGASPLYAAGLIPRTRSRWTPNCCDMGREGQRSHHTAHGRRPTDRNTGRPHVGFNQ